MTDVDRPTENLDAVVDRISDVMDHCDDADFLAPTRCAGWCVQDLLFHVLLDAQRGLVVLARPVDEEADTDDLSYWAGRPATDAGGESTRHARFVRRASMAYAEPGGLLAQWKDTSAAVVAVFRRTDPDARVGTQGRVMTAHDFCSTLVVEAALHLLDLRPKGAQWGLPSAVTSPVRATLEALLGQPCPVGWDDTTAALVLAGRQPLPEPMPFASLIPVIR